MPSLPNQQSSVVLAAYTVDLHNGFALNETLPDHHMSFFVLAHVTSGDNHT